MNCYAQYLAVTQLTLFLTLQIHKTFADIFEIQISSRLKEMVCVTVKKVIALPNILPGYRCRFLS